MNNSNSSNNINSTSNSSSTANSSSSRLSAAGGSSTTQACAACKYQRRKCSPDCDLAPYFPADHQRQFLNAHRLFGVSNILKIIRGLDPQRRSAAMKSIIFQSNMRAHDPVGGCYRIILELERQYEHDCHELAIVLHQLALCRQAAADPSSQLPPTLDIDAAPNEDAIYENNFMIAAAAAQQHQQQQQQYFDYFYFDGTGSNGGENNNIENDHEININSAAAAAISGNSVNNNNNDDVDMNGNNATEVDMEVPQSMFSLHPQQEEHEVDDVKPFIDMFDVTHALAIGDEQEVGEITSKAADLDLAAGPYHLISTEIRAKREEANLMENVQEHDLKGAASLFTLTSQDSSYIFHQDLSRCLASTKEF